MEGLNETKLLQEEIDLLIQHKRNVIDELKDQFFSESSDGLKNEKEIFLKKLAQADEKKIGLA
jgi:hypothetical protein